MRLPLLAARVAGERVGDERRRGGDAGVRARDDLSGATTEVGATVDEGPERGPEGRVRVTLRRCRGSERRGSGKGKANCRDGDKANLLQHVVHLLNFGYRGTRQSRPW